MTSTSGWRHNGIQWVQDGVQPVPAAPPAGWYQDPSGAPAMRWWDGGRWTDKSFTNPGQTDPGILAARVGIGVAIAIGIYCSLQPVSLLTGMDVVWVGVALLIGAFLLCFVPRVAPWGVTVMVGIVAGLGLTNALYYVYQLDQKRQELQQIFGN